MAKDGIRPAVMYIIFSVRLVVLSRSVYAAHLSKQRKFKKAGIGNDGIFVYVCSRMVPVDRCGLRPASIWRYYCLAVYALL